MGNEQGEANALDQGLVELAIRALDHGVRSIDGGAGPLIPFMLTREGIHRFVTERIEEGVERAREMAAQVAAGGTPVVIAYDGFLTAEGKRTDAILVCAAAAGRGPAHIFAQRYIAKRRGKVEPVGNPGYLGSRDGLFSE